MSVEDVVCGDAGVHLSIGAGDAQQINMRHDSQPKSEKSVKKLPPLCP